MSGPLSQAELNDLHNKYQQDRNNAAGQQLKQQQQPKKKPTGNLFTNLLPAIGGGLGAVAGIPLDIFGGAGSIAGGAGGAALGEALKEKLTGQNLSAKQIGIQGAEGGVLSAFNPLKALGAASNATKGFVKAGADSAAQAATKTATNDVGSTVADKLVTQGQQAQGRVAGTSAGKSGQIVTTPQDTARFNAILSKEKIPIGNANTTLQAVQTKLDQYGKQIGDHFTANNTPLNTADTKTLAAGYLNGLKTTDPGVLKQASVLANDLEKNVKDTKGLWEFRKALDTRIPDAKLAAGNNVLSDKMTAIKSLRQHISDQLGDIPGSSQYHDLSEVKPLVAGEAQRLNNPGGGIAGRIFASGPAQKMEAQVGKASEAVGSKLGGRSADQTTENIGQRIAGAGAPPPNPDDLTSALQSASDAAGQIGNQSAKSLPTTSRAAQALASLKGVATFPARAAAAPLAYPGKSIAQVGKQAIGRGIGDIATQQPGAPQEQPAQNSTSLTDALMQAQGGSADQSQSQSQSPYSQDDLQYDIQRDPQNAEKYIEYYQNLDKIYNPTTTSTTNKPTAQQYGLANSGVQSLQELANMIQTNPDIISKNATPGQGLPLVGSLISNSAGASGYHSLADNVLQAIIHLQTGATATKEETTAARGQLPQPGDSDAVRQQKLQTLLSDFSPFLGGTQ